MSWRSRWSGSKKELEKSSLRKSAQTRKWPASSLAWTPMK